MVPLQDAPDKDNANFGLMTVCTNKTSCNKAFMKNTTEHMF